MSTSHHPLPTASAVVGDSLVELLYQPEGRTSFARYTDGSWAHEEEIALPDGRRLVPYSPENNLLRHQVVLLPSEPEEYGEEGELRKAIRSFIHRYVDLSPRFEEVATSYVFLSWLYDSFEELPYLRVRGDFGSGKSRFLLTVGRLTYKPIFASGASTISPIFRILDAFRGTLVIDESDFRFSDERAEVVKIFNNGNARGFPVLRTESQPGGREFDPRAYTVFGPKLIATRGNFEDQALESRCLTEDLGLRPLRRDIPLNLPKRHEEEARHLRNQLLLFRFRNRGRRAALASPISGLPPRLSQIYAPLLAVTGDESAREEILAFAREGGREMATREESRPERLLLEVIRDLSREECGPLSLKDLARCFSLREGTGEVSPRWIGFLLRQRLHLMPERRHGSFVLSRPELSKLPVLLDRFGLSSGDVGDLGDVGETASHEKEKHDTEPRE